MNLLSTRKKLLIAESELNRAHLAQEWQAVTDDIHALAHQARTIRSLAAMALTAVSSLVSLRHKAPVPSAEKPSWLQSLLKGAKLAGSLWAEFRTPKQ